MALTSAEFKCLRESMGLTTKWLASYWGVAEQSVQRWERSRTPPDRICASLAELKLMFDNDVERLSEQGGEYLLVPRNDSFRTDDDKPASWDRMIAQRVSERITVRILFNSDSPDKFAHGDDGTAE